ncbi:hypothetical protein ACFOLJ_15975 [Rugamonas sp. CCM 8940]|uniref:hypothetical protein n=1 Tax=Rugamonas sp. CCM 8940 TaxID=2765359 RepID=UPI0018F457D3|nr:hypothetical protein [Rugamonas sp. CCM 8940]MBJ7309080.1 hypothetical protein [Rugamonas sp. CCM 8940]
MSQIEQQLCNATNPILRPSKIKSSDFCALHQRTPSRFWEQFPIGIGIIPAATAGARRDRPRKPCGSSKTLIVIDSAGLARRGAASPQQAARHYFWY